jgi:hypothetical protein
MTMQQAPLQAAWTCGMMLMAAPMQLALLLTQPGRFNMISQSCKTRPGTISPHTHSAWM